MIFTTSKTANVDRNCVLYHIFFYFFFSLQPDTSRLSRYIKPLADQMTSMKEYDDVSLNSVI